MPLTAKGRKIRREMRKEYGKKKGDEVFYASVNSGKLTDAEVKHQLRRRAKRNA